MRINGSAPDSPKRGGLTRRGFLKSTAVVGACGVLGSKITLTALADQPGAAVAGDAEEVFRGVCHPNCFGMCHLNVHVRDGKVVKTSRAPYNDPRYSRICQRGLSHVQRIYDPSRVLYPLKRVEGTERGAGEWERITWDEAISEITAKMQELQQQYGNQSVGVYYGSNVSMESTFDYVRMYQALDMTSVTPAVDAACQQGQNQIVGGSTIGGAFWEGNERTDLVNARSIVAWGDNLTVAQHHNWHFVKEARRSGTKLVVIDPTFTHLASLADLWIPINPGTDTALLLALCNMVIERGDVNERFLKDKTCAPFLVRSDTGMYLRASEVVAGEAEAKAAQEAAAQAAYDQALNGAIAQGLDPVVAAIAAGKVKDSMAFDDQPMVLQDGKLVKASEATDPELSGSYTASGVKCSTAYDLLVANVADMPIDRASQITGIPEADIEKLYEVVIDQPVTHYVGYGSQAYRNGVHTTLAGFTLCGLLGNIGYEGACWGGSWTMYQGTNSMFAIGAGMSMNPPVSLLDLASVVETQTFQGQPYPLKALYVHDGNPICCSPDTAAWRDKIVANLELIVTADSFMTDTACYSDYVLPVAHWFEQNLVIMTGEVPALSYSEKAIEPLGEAKTDVEIIHLIAEQYGLGDYFPADNDEVNAQCLESEMSAALGISFEKLKEEKEIRWYKDEPHVAYRDAKFETPSGRLEFYCESPTPRVLAENKPSEERIAQERMAHWFPPTRIEEGSEERQAYPLQCISERPRFRVHSQWFSTPLLREIDPEPIVKMNPADAESRGLEESSYVEVYNDRGHVVAKLVYSNGVRPGTVQYPKGWQASQHKAGSWSELISAEYDEFAVNSSFMETVCEVRSWKGGE